MPDQPIHPNEYRRRLARTRQEMARVGLDALFAYANKTHPGHVRYLTGYETRLGIHDSAVCVITERDCVLVTNASFDRADRQTWLQQAVVTSDYATAIADVLPAEARSIGAAGFAALPAPIYIGLQRRLPRAEIRDAAEVLLALRQIKSPAEIALLRACTRITDAGGRAFLEWARPGISEREVLVQVEAALKRAGSDEVSFSTQISSGPRTAQVVAFATDTMLEADTPVQLDCGASYHGYRGDLSRMRYLGTARGRLRHLMEATAEMYHRCLERMRPGVSCADIGRLACRIAHEHGLEDCLYYSPNHAPGFVGHGIGCSYTEPPELHPSCSTVLEKNMVIVLEPILSDPAVGGVKIEDSVLITDEGPERLSELPIES